MVDVTISGPGRAQMKALAAQLRTADPHLKNALRRRMREIAAPTVRRVQTSIMDMAGTQGGGRMREEIAASVSSSVGITPSGMRLDIVSRGSRMPPGMDSMPKHVDSRSGWAHPVFARHGRKEVWVRQHGKTQWFEDPVISAGRAIQDAAQAAMDETAAWLERQP